MTIDPNFVNMIFVISLVLLAICFIVFLSFFIPVMIQIAKTLEAIQTIASLLKEYSLNFNDKLSEATEGLSKFRKLAFDLCGSLFDSLLTTLTKK